MKPSDYVRKGWCQKVSAIDEDGTPIHPTWPTAKAWCLTGAVYAANPEDMQARSLIYDALGEDTALAIDQLVKWNDDPQRTQAEVIALLESVGA